jgi:hypothetical protein
VISGESFRVNAGAQAITGSMASAQVAGERIVKISFAVVRRHSPLLD